MTDSSNMQQLRDTLSPLALSESDFAAGDTVVEHIAKFKAAINAVDSDAEPWLREWLADEHYKGAVLYAAAKTNWNHEQRGAGNAADREMRARIISRFNAWGEQLLTRLDHYEQGRRTAVSVTAWRSQLALFKLDPVRND